jgi:hypothetical protein
VIDATAEEPCGGTRHLVDHGVDPGPPIPFQHEIHVQGDLDDVADALAEARQHVTDPSLHPVTQADRDVGWKPPTEAVAVQNPI